MQQRKIYYNSGLKQVARKLRNSSTLAEVLLWSYLKGKQMKGYDFHRQKPIGNYIVDFFCNKLLLAIEIDGSSHDNKYEYDIKRQRKLEQLGIKFLRFTDLQIRRDMKNVLRGIEGWIEEYEKTHP